MFFFSYVRLRFFKEFVAFFVGIISPLGPMAIYVFVSELRQFERQQLYFLEKIFIGPNFRLCVSVKALAQFECRLDERN